jgi:hypothetical protein
VIISFGDGVDDALLDALAAIQVGLIVALLADGEEVPTSQKCVPHVDVKYLGLGGNGVLYGEIDEDGDRVNTTVHCRSLESIARVHIY